MKQLLIASAFVLLNSLSTQVGAECAWVIVKQIKTPDQLLTVSPKSVVATTEFAETLAECETKVARFNHDKEFTEKTNKQGTIVEFYKYKCVPASLLSRYTYSK